MTLRSRKAKGMAGEEEGRILPEHLVEKVIAMLPFPSIFKARCLSRSWLARLSPISSLQDHSTKSLAMSFQKQVSRWSSNWRTFCPVYIDADVFTAYDRVSENWLKFPSLSYLPKRFLSESTLQMEGPLLYGFARRVKRSTMDLGGYGADLWVANVLTGRWKQLPSRPKEGEHLVFKLKLVIGTNLETYKVILVCYESLVAEWRGYEDQTIPDDHKIYIQIYDSDSDAWIEKAFIVSVNLRAYFLGETADAFLKGVLYIAKPRAKLHSSMEFVVIDVNEGTVEEIKLPDVDMQEYKSASLLVCKSNLFMVLHAGRRSEYRLNLRKIDLSSHSSSEVGQFVETGKMYFNHVSDGDRIFFLGCKIRHGPMLSKDLFFGSHVMEYNFHEHEFTFVLAFVSNVPPSTDYTRGGSGATVVHVPGLTPFIDHRRKRWMRSFFQPGLSPFVTV